MKLIYLTTILNLLFPCTIGIAYDIDNRPIIWKNRDKPICCNEDCDTLNSIENRQNTLYVRNNNISNDYLSITSAQSISVYFGMNDKGLAIANSLVGNNTQTNFSIEDNRSFRIHSEATLIKRAMLECENMDCFESLLIDSLYAIENDTISSNFAVFDSYGDAGIFEIYANQDTVIWGSVFLDIDSLRYINRSNHFEFDFLEYFNPLDSLSTSYERLSKANQILEEIINEFEFEKIFHLESFLNNESSLPLLRNFSKSNLYDYPVPYAYQNSYNRPFGYFYTDNSVNRARTVSSGIIIGVTSEEGPEETQIWTNIGNPTVSPYFPFKINDFINYSVNDEGDDIPDAFPLLLRGENNQSEFSILTNQIRERLFNYSSNCSFNSYIDSYLLSGSDGIFNLINQIENNLIQNNFSIDINLEVENAYNELLEYYNSLVFGEFQDFSCETGFQFFNSFNSNRIIDQSKHNPIECYWEIYNEDNLLIAESDSCFNPDINYPITENLVINHSVAYEEEILYECDSFYFLKGDLNLDESVDILDVVVVVNLILNNDFNDIADMNLDQILDILDIVQIINIILN